MQRLRMSNALKMAPQPAMLTDQIIEAVNASEDLAAFWPEAAPSPHWAVNAWEDESSMHAT